MRANLKEFKTPTNKPVKVFSDDFVHSAIITDTWGNVREECWKAAYSEGCISKDMAVKGFDKEQTLAVIKQEEKSYEEEIRGIMEELIALGDVEYLDSAGRPKTTSIGERASKIPTLALRNKIYKEIVG